MATEDSGRDEARRQAERELDAFNAEQSGVLSGYRGRHLPDDPDTRRQRTAKKDADTKRQLSALQSLLASDPAYAALYNDTLDKLSDAEEATEAALEAALADLGAAKDALAETLDQANTLPDGTRVFRNAEGEVFTEDGERVAGDDLETIVWREDSPSYEDYRGKRDAVSEAQTRIEALRDYQTNVLGDARNRLEDEDNPPDKNELEDIQNDIENKAPAGIMPERSPEVKAPDSGPSAGIEKPVF